MICAAHGPGHAHREQEAEVGQALDEQGPGPAAGGTTSAAVSSTGKSFKEAQEKSALDWGAVLTTGWESRHIHYGVNETGNGGAWTTDAGVSIGDLALSAWSGFGLGNDFEEWDFTASYRLEAGPVFFIPGYNFRYAPGYAQDSHDGHEDHDHEGEEHEEEEHSSHAHLLYNNELFAILGTNAIPYITPSAAFIWNLNDTPGLRIDGEVHGDVTASGSDGGSILVVGEKATVRGRVSAAHVIVNGAIDGPVHCEQLLELHPKARVVGDVRYELLEMHPGAIVEGELRPLKSADKPALKLAASNDA